jgi:hypothetical protein
MQVAGYLLQMIGLTMIGLVSELPAALLGCALIGLGFAFAFPIATGALQSEVPDAMRGRVMAYHTLFHLGNRPFVALFVGTLATFVGAQTAVFAGVVLAPLGLVVTRIAWRQLSEERREPERALASAAVDV